MSSGSLREPLYGIIVQYGKVVGSICMPDATLDFIEEFNHCYGPLRMQVNEIDTAQGPRTPKYQFRLPTWYRQMFRPISRKEPPRTTPNAEPES